MDIVSDPLVKVTRPRLSVLSVPQERFFFQFTYLDDSFEVEQQCQQVISEMEEVLGESLQKYF